MKSVGLSVTFLFISFIALADHRKDLLRAQPYSGMAIVVANDPAQASQTAITFLNWYKNHIQVASRISLVNYYGFLTHRLTRWLKPVEG